MLAYKTAITRSSPSSPASYLVNNGFITKNSKVLDFGCGKGFDAFFYKWEKFDPHFFPEYPVDKFEVVTCFYVLNVIPSESDRKKVLEHIDHLLDDSGVAYVAVRNDIRNEGTTKIGTWQGRIKLPFEVVHKNKNFILYTYKKGDSNKV